MSIRTPYLPSVSSRLHDVLAAGAALRGPPPVEPVYTSDGTFIGHAQLDAGPSPTHVFVSPEQLRGVRVHPPFRVGTPQGGPSPNLAAGLASVLSGALGR